MKKNHPQVTPINMPLTVHNIHRVHKICFLHDQTSWKLAPTPNEMLTTNKKNIKKSTSKGEKLWSTRRCDSAVLNPTPSDAWTESHVQRHQKWNGFETRPTKAHQGLEDGQGDVHATIMRHISVCSCLNVSKGLIINVVLLVLHYGLTQ